jgi:hypothetical protein
MPFIGLTPEKYTKKYEEERSERKNINSETNLDLTIDSKIDKETDYLLQELFETKIDSKIDLESGANKVDPVSGAKFCTDQPSQAVFSYVGPNIPNEIQTDKIGDCLEEFVETKVQTLSQICQHVIEENVIPGNDFTDRNISDNFIDNKNDTLNEFSMNIESSDKLDNGNKALTNNLQIEKNQMCDSNDVTTLKDASHGDQDAFILSKDDVTKILNLKPESDYLLDFSNEFEVLDVEKNFENCDGKNDEKDDITLMDIKNNYSLDKGVQNLDYLDLNGGMMNDTQILRSNEENCPGYQSIKLDDVNHILKSNVPSKKFENEEKHEEMLEVVEKLVADHELDEKLVQEPIIICQDESRSENCKMISSECELTDKVCYQNEPSNESSLSDELESESNQNEFFNSSEFSMPFGHYNSIEQKRKNGEDQTDSNLNLVFSRSQFFGLSIDEEVLQDDGLNTKIASQDNQESGVNKVDPEFGAKFCTNQSSEYVSGNVGHESLNENQADQNCTFEQPPMINGSVDTLSQGYTQNLDDQDEPNLCQNGSVCSDLLEVKDQNCLDINENQSDKADDNILSDGNEIQTPQSDLVDDQVCHNSEEMVSRSGQNSITVQDHCCIEYDSKCDGNCKIEQKSVQTNVNPDLDVNHISAEGFCRIDGNVEIMSKGWPSTMNIQNVDNHENFSFFQNNDKTEHQNEENLLTQAIAAQFLLVNSNDDHGNRVCQENLSLDNKNLDNIPDEQNTSDSQQNEVKNQTELGKIKLHSNSLDLMSETQQIHNEISYDILDAQEEMNNLIVVQDISQVSSEVQEIQAVITQDEFHLNDPGIDPDLISSCSGDQNNSIFDKHQNDTIQEKLSQLCKLLEREMNSNSFEEKHSNEDQNGEGESCDNLPTGTELNLANNSFIDVHIKVEEHEKKEDSTDGNGQIENEKYQSKCEKIELQTKEENQNANLPQIEVEEDKKIIKVYEEFNKSENLESEETQIILTGQEHQKNTKESHNENPQTLQQLLEFNAIEQEVNNQDFSLLTVKVEQQIMSEESQCYKEVEVPLSESIQAKKETVEKGYQQQEVYMETLVKIGDQQQQIVKEEGQCESDRHITEAEQQQQNLKDLLEKQDVGLEKQEYVTADKQEQQLVELEQLFDSKHFPEGIEENLLSKMQHLTKESEQMEKLQIIEEEPNYQGNKVQEEEQQRVELKELKSIETDEQNQLIEQLTKSEHIKLNEDIPKNSKFENCQLAEGENHLKEVQDINESGNQQLKYLEKDTEENLNQFLQEQKQHQQEREVPDNNKEESTKDGKQQPLKYEQELIQQQPIIVGKPYYIQESLTEISEEHRAVDKLQDTNNDQVLTNKEDLHQREDSQQFKEDKELEEVEHFEVQEVQQDQQQCEEGKGLQEVELWGNLEVLEVDHTADVELEQEHKLENCVTNTAVLQLVEFQCKEVKEKREKDENQPEFELQQEDIPSKELYQCTIAEQKQEQRQTPSDLEQQHQLLQEDKQSDSREEKVTVIGPTIIVELQEKDESNTDIQDSKSSDLDEETYIQMIADLEKDIFALDLLNSSRESELAEINSTIAKERTESSQLETELQENIDILDRDIFTLNECVDMGEVTQEELEFEILKEQARSELILLEKNQQELYWRNRINFEKVSISQPFYKQKQKLKSVICNFSV